MQLINGKQKDTYKQNYPIDHLFSTPILKDLEIHAFEPGEWINKEGMLPNFLYYVIEGRAKIYVTEANGKVTLINFAEANSFIGEMELLHDVYYSKGIQTTVKTICYGISLSLYRNQLLNDTAFLRNLCKFLGKKASQMSARYSQVHSYPLENRLAQFILLSSHENIYNEKHTEVCDYLGVSYRHLLFVLAQFCEQNLLIKEGRHYIIINKDALQLLANPLL